MLKRLELIGFKSFADKTRFEFAAGITAVVGPNGSGKSNVVDAVRWILGEQSAKSLRGGEMADVIFNGAATRRALGMAEVSMAFDNARKILNSDAGEVEVTRRVYRDGTGEYLINGAVCRLKDVRELFLGSGAGPGSYCIIEQGRVEALLQSSPKERRLIFEEAAGISRFKARKVETLRKLEATALNLSRVEDIVGEIDRQLKKVRAEAAKAKSWQAWHGRLRELRIGSGLREYRELQNRIGMSSAAAAECRAALGETALRMAEWEAEAQHLDPLLAEAERLARECDEAAAGARQEIAARQAEFAQGVQQAEQLEREEAEHAGRIATVEAGLRALRERLQQHGESLANAESAVAELRRGAESHQKAWDELARIHEEEAGALRTERERQFDLFQQAGKLAGETERRAADVRRLQAERDRHRRQAEQARAERDSFDRGLESLKLDDGQLQGRLAEIKNQFSERQRERADLTASAEAIRRELDELRLKREGTSARIDVLQTLEQSQEGLAIGVREVMARLQRGDPGLKENVLGLVADLLNVPGELAPFVDMALGEISQRFVVADAAALDRYLADPANELPGRASFIPLQSAHPPADGHKIPAADKLVTCDRPELAGLPHQLLGKTRIVDDLSEARALARDPDCVGSRFATRNREVLEADGTLTVGSRAGESGIVSRKSELRDLKGALRTAESEFRTAEEALDSIRRALEAGAAPLHGLEHELGNLNRQVDNLERAIEENRRKREYTAGLFELLQSELAVMEVDLQRLEAESADLSCRAAETRAAAEESSARIAAGEGRQRECETRRPILQEQLTASRVLLGQREIELDNLRQRHLQLRAEEVRELRSLSQGEAERAERIARRQRCELLALEASNAIAEFYAMKESAQERGRGVAAERSKLQGHRAALEGRLRQAREENAQVLAELHRAEMQQRDGEGLSVSLCARLAEEFQIDLADFSKTASESPFADWLGEAEPVPEWRAEAAALKEQIRKLGGVNPDSLVELQELEARAAEIRGQCDDLKAAHKSLLEIIEKINGDSQRMLGETFAAVKDHFQTIFSQLFGGGTAEIVLEDPNDLLESGMEIVARPPGKELRSISLMSGGEKTMTAVALLLAIFRSKPSPFCLLDEVDAALDEANCRRLAEALREFAQQSQFIVITHKKRVMATADVLYGITMQESGVSKQVPLRFEDWVEEGETKPRLAA